MAGQEKGNRAKKRRDYTKQRLKMRSMLIKVLTILVLSFIHAEGVDTYQEELKVWPLPNQLNLLNFNYEFNINMPSDAT